MNSLKCARCGLVNFAHDANCKRCGAALAAQPPVVEVVAPVRWQPPQYAPVQPMFHCPFCRSSYPPYRTSKISTGGWVVFILLLLFLCWPLCWIGLLIKEDQTFCSTCHMKLA